MSAFEKCGAQATTWGRPAASSYLPDAFAADPDRLARFQREAHVLASLNHPNIAQIHGIEKSEDTQALVLELVEGPTLADRIAKGPIPLDEALPIAKQIAEALEAAHEAGVIHRDLKPANIKVREDGTVKVLDFGLAKALAGDAADPDLSHSPTVTASVAGTRQGVVLGTAAYMSPEQARGKPLDKRTDMWSFGCVFYEMLTGRAAFARETLSDTIASVLEHEPDEAGLPMTAREPVRRLVRRCLVKERRGRIPDAAMVRIEIDEADRSPGPMPPEEQGAFRWLRWAVAVLGSGVVGGFAVWFLIANNADSTLAMRQVRFSVSLPPSEGVWSAGSLTIAADGSRVAFVGSANGTPALYVRDMDGQEIRPVRDTDGAEYPFFSPDGGWLGFWVADSLRKVSLAGGPSETICNECRGLGAVWAADGTIVFGSSTQPVYQVSAQGGRPQALDVQQLGQIFLRVSQSLPESDAVLVTVRYSGSVDGSDVAVLSLRTGALKTIAPGNQPYLLDNGDLLFAREDSIWSVPFDHDGLTPTGNPRPVLEGLQVGSSGGALFAASRRGTLAFIAGGGSRVGDSIMWVDRTGGVPAPVVGQPAQAEAFFAPRISSDGRLVALQVLVDGNHDLWFYDTLRGTFERATVADEYEGSPAWAPDGTTLAYTATNERALHVRTLGTVGEGELLLTREGRQYPNAWTPDQRQLLFSEVHPDRGADILVFSIADRNVTPVVATNASSPW